MKRDTPAAVHAGIEPSDGPGAAETVAAARALLERRAARLHERACRLREHWWAAHARARRTRERRDWGLLGLRVTRRESAAGELSFDALWYRTQWVRRPRGAEAPWRPFTRYIRKGRGPGYALGAVLAGARGWERDLAPRIERELAGLRAEMRHIARIRRALRDYERWSRSEVAGAADPEPGAGR